LEPGETNGDAGVYLGIWEPVETKGDAGISSWDNFRDCTTDDLTDLDLIILRLLGAHQIVLLEL
jgi:hypothetical protein